MDPPVRRSEDRDAPPHVVSWRLTHYGVLEATLTVGGRTFRGELAPLGRTKRPAEASPPDKPPKRLGRPPVRGCTTAHQWTLTPPSACHTVNRCRGGRWQLVLEMRLVRCDCRSSRPQRRRCRR